jgi:hypothetical protein
VINDQSIGGVRSKLRRDALLVDATQAGYWRAWQITDPRCLSESIMRPTSSPLPQSKARVSALWPGQVGPGDHESRPKRTVRPRPQRVADFAEPVMCSAPARVISMAKSSLALNELVSQGPDRWWP